MALSTIHSLSQVRFNFHFILFFALRLGFLRPWSLCRLTGAFLLSACRDAVVEEAEPQGMLDSWAGHPHTRMYALPLLMVQSGTFPP
jgi:hypothetical protein